jgi:hypothetical protein
VWKGRRHEGLEAMRERLGGVRDRRRNNQR